MRCSCWRRFRRRPHTRCSGAAPFPNGQTYNLDKATADQIFGRTVVAGSDVDKGTEIYAAVGSFIVPWARMLARGVGALLALSEVAALSVLSVVLLAVIVVTGVPASTPLAWTTVSVLTWGGWALDLLALQIVRVFGGEPKIASLVLDTIGLIVGFLVGLAGSFSRMIAAEKPNDRAAEMLGAVDVFASLAADGGILAMASKEPETVAIAAATTGVGTQVSSVLATIAASWASFLRPRRRGGLKPG